MRCIKLNKRSGEVGRSCCTLLGAGNIAMEWLPRPPSSLKKKSQVSTSLLLKAMVNVPAISQNMKHHKKGNSSDSSEPNLKPNSTVSIVNVAENPKHIINNHPVAQISFRFSFISLFRFHSEPITNNKTPIVKIADKQSIIQQGHSIDIQGQSSSPSILVPTKIRVIKRVHRPIYLKPPLKDQQSLYGSPTKAKRNTVENNAGDDQMRKGTSDA